MSDSEKLNFLSLFLILSMCGCSFSKPAQSSKVQISHDVLVESLTPEELLQFESIKKDSSLSCPQHFKKVTCLSQSEELGFDSKCSSENVTEEMLSSLNLIYSELPDFHKKVLCHLNQIQIHRKMMSIGYVSAVRSSEGLSVGSVMGLKIEMLSDNSENKSMSWKEQLNFGLTDLKDPTRTPSPNGPFLNEKVPSQLPQLFAVVVHELNHLIDMFNGVNSSFGECTPIAGKEFLYRCKHEVDSFPTLSWGDEVELVIDDIPEGYQYSYPRPIWSSQFPLLSQLCYYWCEGKVISPSLIQQTYQQLYESSFLTAYSTAGEMEDFAESAMIWSLLQTERPLNYIIKDGSGQTLFESDIHLKSSVVQPKLKWLKEFFNRNDLKFKFDEPSSENN
jgi:hypothetical protein